MRETKSIEEQVAELTEEQKNNIVHVYRWDAGCVMISAGISVLIFSLLSSSSFSNILDSKALFAIFGCVFMFVAVIVFVIFKVVVKISVPYYDKYKARHIIKMRSSKQ